MAKFLSSFVMVLLITGCSNGQSLELVKGSVEVQDGEEIEVLNEEKTERTLESKELTYHFVIENTGNKSIGGMTDDTRIKAKIVPNGKLEEVSQEIMGFNIYENYEGLGHRISAPPLLKPNEKGEYIFSFGLGAKEKYPENIVIAPSSEKMNELEKHSMNSTLVILVGDKEIANFDLNEFN